MLGDFDIAFFTLGLKAKELSGEFRRGLRGARSGIDREFGVNCASLTVGTRDN
jgi:hypothetical protein